MKIKSFIAGLCCLLVLSSLSACQEKKSILDPENPVTVTIWNYYNGDQLFAFENLVKEFNDSIGAEKGIVVVSVSQGSIDNLANALLDSVLGKAGAANIPSAASIYAETAFILNEEEAITPLDSYFTQEELDEYIPSFIEEGKLVQGGELLIMPVSKSTEAFIANLTDWEGFEAATGISFESITTYESLTSAAKSYYEYTDSLTPEIANDGKALYGRDSIANYIYVGTKQLGHEMFVVGEDGSVSVDLDKDTFRTLWDNYYIPNLLGYFGSFAKFRSEDIKTGTILCMTGSTSGMSYIPTSVTDMNDETHDIEIGTKRSLSFENAVEDYSVQQGAGYCVMKTSEAEELATVEFLKWFTDTQQNLSFSITSGYSPVKIEANNVEKIASAFVVDSPKAENVLAALTISSEIYTSNVAYTSKAFDGSKDIRSLLENCLTDIVNQDRAVVVEALAQGASLEEATSSYLTEEYFDVWFNQLKSQIESIIQ